MLSRFSDAFYCLALILAILCAFAQQPALSATTTVPLADDFETSSLGSLPYGWKLAGNILGTSATVVDSWAGRTSRIVRLHDDNGANGSNPAQNNTLHRFFPKIAFDRCVYQFDVSFATIHAGFGARITNGGVPTTGSSWCAAVIFEGDVPYNSVGPAPGTLSYQQYTIGTDAYLRTIPAASFSADTWYTVRIDADFDTKLYKIFFGPKGGVLAEVTPAGGVPFIRTTAGNQVFTAGGVTFFTSNKTGEPPGDMYIDNVSVTATIPVADTVADAKTTNKNTTLQIVDKVASAGTDQMGKPFFYIQDDTGGIRIRTTVPVRQGDLVAICGASQRAADNGTAVLRNGEREINANNVIVTYGPFAVPRPLGMKTRSVGGGPFLPNPPGPLDTDGYPFQPGVWARGTGATSGYDQIDEVGLSTVGRYVRVWGKVVYADDANRFFYINDGSDVQDGGALPGGTTSSPKGVRVLAPPGVPLTGILNKFAVITGIAGSVAQSDAGSPKGPGGNYIRNVRVIRPTCEPFLDLNLNGFWDPGEAFIDTNSSGAYDGIRIDGVPGPNFISGFDRYGTCILRGQPFFPKGIYAYSVDGGTLSLMRNQGFNTVFNFDSMTINDLPAFNARGLKTLPILRDPGYRPTWMSVRNDNAIVGWYVHDEPEYHGISPEQALADYQWVKSQDPLHFAGNSHLDPSAFAPYTASDDFTMPDNYPLYGPTSPITPIADLLAYAHGAHGGDYFPVWQWIQMYQGYDHVLPTPTQLRAMVYLALAFHAKGILHWAYQGPNDAWNAAAVLNAELDMFRPFLVLPWYPLDATTSTEAVRIGGFRVGGSALIITVNVTASEQTATFTLPGISAASLTLPLEGGATQPLVNRSFTYTYAPYQTRVLLWGSIPPGP